MADWVGYGRTGLAYVRTGLAYGKDWGGGCEDCGGAAYALVFTTPMLTLAEITRETPKSLAGKMANPWRICGFFKMMAHLLDHGVVYLE